MRINTIKLQLMMGKCGFTSAALADRAGMCRQNFSTIKHRGTCTPITLQKIADALGCDPAELIEKEG